MLRALIWDVDGTVAETERDGHRVAFNAAFEAAGLPWRWDVSTYGRLLEVAGGRERLMHDLVTRADAPASEAARAELAGRLHATKNAFYARIVETGGLAWRPGVRRLMDACDEAGIAQAIATTTSRGNVDALFATALGPHWTDRFRAIVCAEDAPSKKPDPLVYRIALQRLGVDARDAVAIEDSPNGLAAARGAGIATLIARSDYFMDAAFDGATAICDSLDEPLIGADRSARRVDPTTLEGLVTRATVSPVPRRDR